MNPSSCPRCYGTGLIPKGINEIACPDCTGTGQILASEQSLPERLRDIANLVEHVWDRSNKEALLPYAETLRHFSDEIERQQAELKNANSQLSEWRKLADTPSAVNLICELALDTAKKIQVERDSLKVELDLSNEGALSLANRLNKAEAELERLRSDQAKAQMDYLADLVTQRAAHKDFIVAAAKKLAETGAELERLRGEFALYKSEKSDEILLLRSALDFEKKQHLESLDREQKLRGEREQDTARLDWLSSNTVSISHHPPSPYTQRCGDLWWKGRAYRGETLRQAIDAARDAAREQYGEPTGTDYDLIDPKTVDAMQEYIRKRDAAREQTAKGEIKMSENKLSLADRIHEISKSKFAVPCDDDSKELNAIAKEVTLQTAELEKIKTPLAEAERVLLTVGQKIIAEERDSLRAEVARLKQESKDRADKIREMVPNYMSYWPPLNAVKHLAEEYAKAKELNRQTVCTYCGYVATIPPEEDRALGLKRIMVEHIADCEKHPIKFILKIKSFVDLYFSPWGAAKGVMWEEETQGLPFGPEAAMRHILKLLEGLLDGGKV